jgi:hypothetical protein
MKAIDFLNIENLSSIYTDIVQTQLGSVTMKDTGTDIELCFNNLQPNTKYKAYVHVQCDDAAPLTELPSRPPSPTPPQTPMITPVPTSPDPSVTATLTTASPKLTPEITPDLIVSGLTIDTRRPSVPTVRPLTGTPSRPQTGSPTRSIRNSISISTPNLEYLNTFLDPVHNPPLPIPDIPEEVTEEDIQLKYQTLYDDAIKDIVNEAYLEVKLEAELKLQQDKEEAEAKLLKEKNDAALKLQNEKNAADLKLQNEYKLHENANKLLQRYSITFITKAEKLGNSYVYMNA